MNMSANTLALPAPSSSPAPVRVVACPRPFAAARVDMTLPAGLTLGQMLAAAGIRPGMSARVQIGDRDVPAHLWHQVRPKAGQVITARVVPQGGNSKNILSMVLRIAVMAFALWVVGPGALALSGFAAAAVEAGIGIVGNLIISAIAPPPQQRLSNLSTGQQPSRSYSITGIRNAANPYGVVPVVLGTHRIYPPFGARPYTEIAAGKQYLRALFAMYGNVAISNIKIGETDLGDFDGVSYQVREGTGADPGLQIYTRTVDQLDLSVSLTPDGETKGTAAGNRGPGAWAQRTTDAGIDEFVVDFACPKGGITVSTDGTSNRIITVNIQYSVTGAGAWTAAPDLTINCGPNSAGQNIVKSSRVQLPANGQYDVRVRVGSSTTGYAGSWSKITSVIDDTFWTSLRSVTYESPISNISELATIALRIQATEQLNSVIDSLNFIGQSRVKDYDGVPGSWTVRATSNPASLFRAVLQNSFCPDARADAELDLTMLEDWWDFCRTNGYEFNAIIDTAVTVPSLLHDIAAAGRASPTFVDGKYSVVIDRAWTGDPAQFFTPRNSWGFSATKRFPDYPHALRVRFVNADNSYQQDERIVYDTGYSSANATIFETLELFGITDKDLAWKFGRFHIAQARLRPEEYQLSADFEHLVCRRGDLVRVQHDVALIGLAAGRITAVNVDGGGDCTDIDLDEVCTMDGAETYKVRIRKADGTELYEGINTVAGDNSNLVFTAAIPSASIPAVGDLVMFGQTSYETADMIITKIAPQSDLSALITLVDYAPDVQTADTGAIPAWTPNIVIPQYLTPPTPVILSETSDESVILKLPGGALQTRIRIIVDPPVGQGLDDFQLQTRWRESGTDAEWAYLTPAPITTAEVYIAGVVDGAAYDIELRYLSKSRVLLPASDWVSIIDYTVIGKSNPPSDVGSFSASQNGALVVFRWTRVADIDVVGYDIRYGPRSTFDFGNATPITRQTEGSQITTAIIPPGDWTFGIKAKDAAGNLSDNAATYDVIVSNFFDAVVADTEHPDWLGLPYLAIFSDQGAADNSLKVDGGTAAAGNLTGDFTLAWQGVVYDMNAAFGNTESQLLGWSASPYPFRLVVTSGGLVRLYVDDGAAAHVDSTDTVTFGEKVTVEVTLTGDQVEFWINGSPDAGGAQAITNYNAAATGGDLEIGSSSGATRLSGYCAYARAWSSALSESDMDDRRHRPLIAAESGGSVLDAWSEGDLPVDHSAAGETVSVQAGAVTYTRRGPVSALGNFILHPTGVLVPDDLTMADGDNYDIFDNFLVSAPGDCYYPGAELDAGFDDTALRVYATISSILGAGVVDGAADPALEIDYRLDAGAYDGYEAWTVGLISARYVKPLLSLDTINDGEAVVQEFSPTIDKDLVAQSDKNVAIAAAGGSTITFPKQYHEVPRVVATAVATTGLLVVVSAPTATGFTAQVFDLTGADVGGTINWQSSGV